MRKISANPVRTECQHTAADGTGSVGQSSTFRWQSIKEQPPPPPQITAVRAGAIVDETVRQARLEAITPTNGGLA